MAATHSLSSTPRKKKKQVPFYEAPDNTSARIITEARRSVRAITTERPCTPAHHRNLFGGGGSQSRPPSAFSIGPKHFIEERSRPGTGQKLPPIEKTIAEDSGSAKKLIRRKVKPTPPTPVQSLQDLSVLSTSSSSQILLTRLAEGDAEIDGLSNSQPRSQDVGEVESGSRKPRNSGELELKQSQFSPSHSKRSMSADTVKRFLMAQQEDGGGENRVISAGNARKAHSKDYLTEAKKEAESGRGNSSVPDKPPPTADSVFWKSEIVPLLRDLEATPYQEVEHLCASCSTLWACLERRGLLGRTGGTGGAKKRSVVLKAVFKLLDHKDPKLLLKVAKIIVSMQVIGKNLLNVCKLLLAVGKNEDNDKLFQAESITGYLIKALLLANPLKEQETLVYGLGVIKLLASSPSLREQMVSTDVMVLINNTLKACCEKCATSQPTAGEMTHMRNIQIQLTGALRSLADATSFRKEFVSDNIIPQLASVLSDHISSPDIVFNISRVLSKLTLDSNCLAAVIQCPPLLPLFLQAISLHSHHEDIVLRICFILGNLTADDDGIRHQLFFSHSPLLHLNPLFEEYLQLERDQISGSQDGHSEAKTATLDDGSKSGDVLIKLVRLIANLSVHSDVGPEIAGDEEMVHFLLMTIANFPLLEYEELVLNTLAALNNLSYYAQADSSILARQEEMAKLMVNVMMVESTDLLLESTRVCGNISRYPQVRDILVRNKVDEVMVTILDSGRREMVFSACGVLINILADSAYHQNVAKNGGVQKLVEVLQDFGQGDWQLAGLVCKTLWNLSENLNSPLSCFGGPQAIQLIQLLANYSNESIALSPSSYNQQAADWAWHNDFLPVAQALLGRMQEYSVTLTSHSVTSKVPHTGTSDLIPTS